jgi:hypothetical protein
MKIHLPRLPRLRCSLLAGGIALLLFAVVSGGCGDKASVEDKRGTSGAVTTGGATGPRTPTEAANNPNVPASQRDSIRNYMQGQQGGGGAPASGTPPGPAGGTR